MVKITKIVGVDEVGRGSWAGPVVAAAVVLSDNISGLRDSKLLSKRQREKLVDKIHEKSMAIGIGWSSNKIVDKFGLDFAVAQAMRDAVSQLSCDYDQIIIDGNRNFLEDNPKVTTVVKADQSIPSVSAASIVAKVARDKYMTKLAIDFPGYGFEKHVGYGTKLHIQRLKIHGICSAHRLTYRPIMGLNIESRTV